MSEQIAETASPQTFAARVRNRANEVFPGLLVAAIIALASRFVAEHYGAPAMLLALLFGMSLNFLGSEARSRPGIDFGSRQILRLGVALLGVRISAEMLGELGWDVILLVVLGVLVTIGFGMTFSRVFGFRYRFAFLSAGAVAICGASAAMAIAAILPKDERSEERLIFTVVGVTMLSTLAMIIYPLIAQMLNFDDRTTGIFIGATVHDV
ncbi:MAG TPA: putative sulfate exporter family transporter, partial [Paracoccaceae bacterium]|nr:putative sulfate exporter family transporter [Paracoccaceae bacterium]